MDIGGRRKRSAPPSGDCNECAALTPTTGAPSTCVKISFRGRIRRFRIPLPLSVDILQKICRHCYGIPGNVLLAYQKQLDGNVVRFNTSEQLLSALVEDKKVSDRGELLMSTCLRIVVTDQDTKKTRPREAAAAAAAAAAAVPAAAVYHQHHQEAAPPADTGRSISVDSIGSTEHRDLLRDDGNGGVASHGAGANPGFLFMPTDGSRTFDFTCVRTNRDDAPRCVARLSANTCGAKW